MALTNVKHTVIYALRFISFLLAVLILVFILSAIYIFSFYSQGFNDLKKADCAVVFGAAVTPDKQASNVLKDRTLTAIELYKEGKVDCLVFSGANSAFGVHEVDVMLQMSQKFQVPTNVVTKDYEGVNTCSTISHLNKNKRYILVSSNFHLARIGFFADFFNLSYQLYPASQTSGHYNKEVFFFVREIFANWYYRFVFDGRCGTETFWISNTVDKYLNKLLKYSF